jgi:hypothetical protein
MAHVPFRGNLKNKGATRIPGADDVRSPDAAHLKKYERLEGSETTYFDEKTSPGPNLSAAAKKRRGKRISRGKTANDAAMALRERMVKVKGV